MTTLLMAKQGSVEHALTVPEDTLFSGVCELMNAWEHKECFTFGAEAAWMLDLDGTEVEQHPQGHARGGGHRRLLGADCVPAGCGRARAQAASRDG